MDSVSVLLNIFRPKCEHAAELRTFRILNCSQLECRFFVIQHVSHRKKKQKNLPTLPNVFSAVTRTTQLFFFGLIIIIIIIIIIIMFFINVQGHHPHHPSLAFYLFSPTRLINYTPGIKYIGGI